MLKARFVMPTMSIRKALVELRQRLPRVSDACVRVYDKFLFFSLASFRLLNPSRPKEEEEQE